MNNIQAKLMNSIAQVKRHAMQSIILPMSFLFICHIASQSVVNLLVWSAIFST